MESGSGLGAVRSSVAEVATCKVVGELVGNTKGGAGTRIIFLAPGLGVRLGPNTLFLGLAVLWWDPVHYTRHSC